VRRGLFASFLAGETRPATRDAGFLDAAAREAARVAGLLETAVRWCATAGFRIVVSEKSVFKTVCFRIEMVFFYVSKRNDNGSIYNYVHSFKLQSGSEITYTSAQAIPISRDLNVYSTAFSSR
jgi:hypothetical protein